MHPFRYKPYFLQEEEKQSRFKILTVYHDSQTGENFLEDDIVVVNEFLVDDTLKGRVVSISDEYIRLDISTQYNSEIKTIQSKDIITIKKA